MPKDICLLKCLNCGNYSVGESVQHRDYCAGPVIVEVITQEVGAYCIHCGAVVRTEPLRCSSCHHVSFDPIYKEPTLSHMEPMIRLLIDALAKSQTEQKSAENEGN